MNNNDLPPLNESEKGPSDGQQNREDGAFFYSYAAPTGDERREIESIRSRYSARSAAEVKLEYVKKLDARVRNVPRAAAAALITAGVLVFGGGLALCLEGEGEVSLAVGIALAVVGIAVAVLAKPVYARAKRAMKKKYGATILKLTSDLLGEEEGAERV